MTSNRKRLLGFARLLPLRTTACLVACLLAPACGAEEPSPDKQSASSATTARRAGQRDRSKDIGSSQSSSFEVLGSSTSNTRPSAAATASDKQRGGGSSRPVDEAEAARRRENDARCERLVDHYVNLTGKRMGNRATKEALDKLEGQTDDLRQLCAGGAWLTPAYEACTLKAKTLDEAIACTARQGPRSSKAYEQAKQLSERKDLLEQAERQIKAGKVPEPTVDVRPDRSRL